MFIINSNTCETITIKATPVSKDLTSRVYHLLPISNINIYFLDLFLFTHVERVKSLQHLSFPKRQCSIPGLTPIRQRRNIRGHPLRSLVMMLMRFGQDQRHKHASGSLQSLPPWRMTSVRCDREQVVVSVHFRHGIGRRPRSPTSGTQGLGASVDVARWS